MNNIGWLLNMYDFDIESIRRALTEVDEKLAIVSNDRLQELVDEAMELSDRAADFEFEWDSTKNVTPEERKRATETDDEIDTTLSSIHDILQTRAELGDTKQGEMAREMLGELFPKGVYPITSANFARQEMHVESLLERMDGPFSEHVEVLQLEDFVDRLARLNEEFDQQIAVGDDDQVTFDEVREARVEARDAFHRVVFAIYGDYCKDPETRQELFAPIRAENERIGRRIARRGGTSDPGRPGGPGEPTDSETDGQNDGGSGQNDGGQSDGGSAENDGGGQNDG
jgi:hypothetical protein